MKRTFIIKISFVQTCDEDKKVKQLFGTDRFHKLSVTRGEKMVYNVSIVTDNEVSSSEINEIMQNNDFIISVERCDD